MIESYFLIKTDDTVYQEHFYKTSGFKDLLGNDIVSEILSTDAISRRKLDIGQKISIHTSFGTFRFVTTAEVL